MPTKTTLFILMMTSLFAQELRIDMPEVPQATTDIPKPVQIHLYNTANSKTNDEILREMTEEKVVHFSNHVAPKIQEIHDDPNKIVLTGDISNGKVTAYLNIPYMKEDKIVTKLTDAGFKVLSTFKVDKKGRVTSIVFTDKDLLHLASKKERGFVALLHVTLDHKEKTASITNPIYSLAAFMQHDYNATVAEHTLKKLRDTFADMTNSKQKAKFRTLEHYQFMKGMPMYQDMQEIKKLPSTELLTLAKKSKKIVYEYKLKNGSILLGVSLSKRTTKFIKKIGYRNAGLLPYPVLIEEDKALILDPKYYIAVMYPMLKMSQFMTISTVPGAIQKDIDRVFR